MIGIGIVGLGFGAEFIPLWQKHPHTDCYAICQRNEEKLNAVGDYFGVAKRYMDFAALLKDPAVDVVHINSPIPDHAWMSIAALKAGNKIAGPALIEEHASTTVVLPGDKLQVDAFGNLVIEVGKRRA